MWIHDGDVRFFVDAIGSGKPLLMMHGPGLDHAYLRSSPLQQLASVSRLVFYDHRGNGRSSDVEEWASFKTGTWIEDADRVRQKLGYEQISVFGHSIGGFLAQEYALAYPHCVDRLILCATAPAFDYPDVVFENLRRRTTPEQFAEFVQYLSGPIADDASLRHAWSRILPAYFHQFDAEKHSKVLDGTHFSSAAFNHGFYSYLPNFNVVGKLPQLSVPTLVFAGSDDWITTAEEGAGRLRRLIPGSQLVLIERSGHFPFIEEGDRFVDALRTWLCT